MHAAHDLGAQGGVNGTMPGKAALLRQCGRLDAYTKMAFARSVVPGMTRVAMAFVQDFQPFRGKGSRQSLADLVFHAHIFVCPPSSSRQMA